MKLYHTYKPILLSEKRADIQLLHNIMADTEEDTKDGKATQGLATIHTLN